MATIRICLGAAMAALASVTLLGQTSAGPAEVVVRGIALVDLANGRVVPGQDIVVRGTRIERIGDAGGPLPQTKTLIEGRGKYVIPGLVDLDVRARGLSTETAQAMLGFGVVAIGDASADAPMLERWRHDLDTGRSYAPRLARPCGPQPARTRTAAASPGAVHDRLAALVSSGRTPAEALRATTIEGARALCLDAGGVAAGRTADFVVLSANPLADIRASRAIDAVVFRGEVLTQAHLTQLRRGSLRPATPE